MDGPYLGTSSVNLTFVMKKVISLTFLSASPRWSYQ